jgi:hypothetical protein
MGADRTKYIIEALGNGEHLMVTTDLRRDCNYAPNASRPCARDDAIELPGKIRKIEMTVTVDQHHQPASEASLST